MWQLINCSAYCNLLVVTTIIILIKSKFLCYYVAMALSSFVNCLVEELMVTYLYISDCILCIGSSVHTCIGWRCSYTSFCTKQLNSKSADSKIIVEPVYVNIFRCKLTSFNSVLIYLNMKPCGIFKNVLKLLSTYGWFESDNILFSTICVLLVRQALN